MICARFLHQVIGGGPVAVTIKECANNSTAQHSRKCFLISRRLKGRDHFIAVRETANVQAFLIRWPTSEARHVRRVGFLEAFFVWIHWGFP